MGAECSNFSDDGHRFRYFPADLAPLHAMRYKPAHAVSVVVIVMLAACARLPDEAPVRAIVEDRDILSAYEQRPEDRVYHILPEQSVLRILVGRAGPLARMGHNHIVTSRDISGTVFVSDTMEDSYADLLIPVNLLLVDETEERRRAGEAYQAELSEADIAATRKNMLGSELLAGEYYPVIRIRLQLLEYAAGQGSFAVSIRIKDREVTLQLPASLSVETDRLSADTRFDLDHEDLGLQPFSALGGALRVADELGFELQIRAKTL